MILALLIMSATLLGVVGGLAWLAFTFPSDLSAAMDDALDQYRTYHGNGKGDG